MKNIVVFTLAGQKYALSCERVDKIVNAVAITHLHHVPKTIAGIINVHGILVAVMDIRRIMELPERPLQLSDKIIITRVRKRRVAFVADSVEGLAEIGDDKVVNMDRIIPDPDIYDGTIKIKGGLILIYNIDKFLSLEDEKKLNEALTD